MAEGDVRRRTSTNRRVGLTEQEQNAPRFTAPKQESLVVNTTEDMTAQVHEHQHARDEEGFDSQLTVADYQELILDEAFELAMRVQCYTGALRRGDPAFIREWVIDSMVHDIPKIANEILGLLVELDDLHATGRCVVSRASD